MQVILNHKTNQGFLKDGDRLFSIGPIQIISIKFENYLREIFPYRYKEELEVSISTTFGDMNFKGEFIVTDHNPIPEMTYIG